MKMRKMNRNMRRWAMTMMAMTLGLMACGSKSAGNSGEGDYPEPSRQQACMNRLYDVLMSPEGRAMTGAQLAVYADTTRLRNVFKIALPVGEDDQLPRMGTYRNDETGGTIIFRQLTEEDPLDTIHAVCQAAVRIVHFEYEDSTSLPQTGDTLLVQDRGRGILTGFRYVHRGGPNGGKHRCYDQHPDGYPEYASWVLAVYPGADSLLYTCGYEASKRTYRYVGEQ